MKLWVSSVLLGLLSASAGANTTGWVERAQVKHEQGNLAFTVRWDPAEGSHVRLMQPDTGASAFLDLSRGGGVYRVSARSNATAVIRPEARFFASALPTNPVPSVKAILKFRPTAWLLYYDDRLAAMVPPAFAPPATFSQPPAEFLAEEKGNARLQRVEDFYFHDDFMVVENEAQLRGWEPQSGAWRLHTAREDAAEEPNNPGATALSPSYSPNYFSLAGMGTNGVIVTGYPFYDNYDFEASVHTRVGEMGLAFLYQDLTNYYAFTLRMDADPLKPAVLRLWRVKQATNATHRVIESLASGSTDLTTNQWVKLRVRMSQERIQCFFDQTPVVDVAGALPSGGKLGFYANAETNVLFDDVTAHTNPDLDLRDAGEVRFNTLAQAGDFFGDGLLSFLSRPSGGTVAAPLSRRPQWLALGASTHGPHVFSARFVPSAGSSEVGLLAGFRGESRPYLRFVREGEGGREQFRLERVDTNRTVILEHLELPFTRTNSPTAGSLSGSGERRGEALVERTRPDDGSVALMADGTEPGQLRLYRNGELVLVHHPTGEVVGASGLYVGPYTRARVSDLRYQFARDDLYKSRREKNRIFAVDPFMRHWSSPEGEWLDQTNNLVWHKSDFFGRFEVEMPFVERAELHMGVGEGRTNGAVVFLVDSNALMFLDGRQYPAKRTVLATAPFRALTLAETNIPTTVSYEGHWVWASSGTGVVFKCPLPQPLAGSRIRIAGPVTNLLHHCFAERYNVKDYLFNEAPAEWVLNGGRWEVINRFSCTPTWSHMNGQSADGLAAMWSKYRFRGDFCIELYAGMRHGWYQRCGDMNITAMGQRTTPSEGYTLTCTGWDPDESQLFSRFYRNGQMLEQSDRYLAPRNREGNRRLHIEAVVAPGRDVHGAWYYIKVRRIGKKIEYYYDNELVFSREDSAPLDDGLVGIWTFMNSMMVARVKIAASEIEPVMARVDRREITYVPPAASPATQGSNTLGLVRGESPVEAMSPDRWDVSDSVGLSTLTWAIDPDKTFFFAVRNRLGSGTQSVRCSLPPVAYAGLAGWQFAVRRTERSQFNFYYSIGHRNGSQEFVPERRFFHRISGPDLSKGEFRMYGETRVPGAGQAGDTLADAPWTTVQAWLPTEGLSAYAGDPTALVRADGFGVMQPSYEVEGLSGNGPGETYEVKDFTEVAYGAPILGLTNAAARGVTFVVQGPEGGAELARVASVSNLNAWVSAASRDGLNSLRVTATASNTTAFGRVAWVQLPKKPVVSCKWKADAVNTVLIESPLPYPDRRVAFGEVMIGGVSVPRQERTFGAWCALVPRNNTFLGSTQAVLAVQVKAGGESYAFNLDWRKRPVPEPPVLVGLEGITPFFENFEGRDFGKFLSVVPERMAIRSPSAARQRAKALAQQPPTGRPRDANRQWRSSSRGQLAVRSLDPLQGSYLEVRNTDNGQRLKSTFNAVLAVSRYPVFEFRYRGEGMVNVSLGLQDTYLAKISETYATARAAAYAPAFVADGQWHSWWGKVSDAVARDTWDSRMFCIQQFSLGSYHGIDQTGRFSEWNIDDLAFGPAVSRPEQLAFTPRYFDFDGVKAVYMGIAIGSASGPGSNELAAVTWKEIRNNEKAVPDIGKLSDGLHRIMIKAVDSNGVESAVTEIPFLLDRIPVSATFAFEATPDLLSNGTYLRVAFDTGGGAPLALEDLQLSWNGKAMSVPGYLDLLTHLPGSESLRLNWPYMFRAELNQMAQGGKATIGIANIQDGAGNRSADVSIPVEIDYAKDKTPPTLLQTKYPTNVLLATAWEGRLQKTAYFQAPYPQSPAVIEKPGEEVYFSTEASAKAGDAFLTFETGKWMLTNYPYVSFRLRRPVVPAKDTTRFAVVVNLSNGGSNVLALTQNETEKGAVPARQPIAWESNRWQEVTLNLYDLLKSVTNEAALQPLSVTNLHIRRLESVEREALHIQSCLVYSKWRPQDAIVMDGYDASGVDGVMWESNNRIAKMEVAPATLATGGRPWIQLQVRDKAGNLSLPIRVPVPQ